MAKSSEYRMAIKIAGEIEKSLYNCTDLTRKELNKIAREAAYASSATKTSFRQGLRETEPFFEGLEKTGVKAFKAMAAAAATAGTAIIGIGTMSAQAGIEFESAFAGVKKTTTATADEYARMKEEILEMTREIPASGAEISAVAETAGQLGIEKENLLAFSRTMIDLGESTNLSSEEAASALAKFANITDMSTDNYGRLGSVIVDLGNNFATTEADIVSMATNMASAGELAGFTEPQIMAMATAMSSVGIEAEAGGSSMSKMIKKVQVAVETGSDSLKDYAEVAGKTVEEFKEDFQKDGLTAVAAFISGLNDIERNGKSATIILDEMGLTEVRLSNTLLSLANADDLMLEAVETANKAWEENTALANEAAQRYETTESKIAIMKNGFTEMGIAMYDQFNEPLREGIDIITDLVHEATTEISGSNVIHDLAQDVINGVPTAMRIIQSTAEAVGNFAEPFLKVGGWLADNPQLLESTITGVGSALITYKTVKGITSLATAFTSLGAASLPVLGLTGAAAVIGGVTVAVKKSAAEAKKANLASHFGNITLSMKEMEEVAAYIIANDSLGQLQESISGLKELDGINNSIEDTVSELNKMNWKVSLGMELKEEEQALYKEDIASYVSNVQSYLEQEQYAVSLSVGVLTGDDLEDSNIVAQLNEFYSGKSTELAAIGTELNKVITDAFQDGLLDIDEAKTITDLQKQMADIKASLAMGSYEANLDLLGMKYVGGELDAETFQNLLTEISEQQEVAKQQYEEAYVAANQAQRAMLNEGTITQKEYNANMEELKGGYLSQSTALDTKAADFAINTIMQQYADEIGNKIENTDALLEDILARSLEETNISENGITAFDAYYLAQNMGGKIKGEDGQAIAELWERFAPIYSQMEETWQQYMQSGEEAPEEMEELIKKASVLGVLSGDYNSIYSGLGVVAEGDEKYQADIEKLQKDNNYIPEQIAASIIGNTDPIDAAASELFMYAEQQLGSQFNKDLDVEANVNLKLRTTSLLLAQNAVRNAALNLPGHSKGGIFDKPHVAWFSEKGTEAAIPIDGSERSVNLWQQTGEMLGVFNQNGFSSLAARLINDPGSSPSNTVNNSEENSKFTYSPTYNFYGDAPSKKDLDEHIEDSFEKWEEMMERWIKNNRRYSFS